MRFGLTWTLQTIAEVHLSLISQKFTPNLVLKSTAQTEYKESFCSHQLTVFSVAVLRFYKYVMFCLPQKLLMPSIPKAPLPVSTMKS